MPWYKRLRWRLIASQFLAALAGAATMLLATRWLAARVMPEQIRPWLADLAATPDLLPQTTQQISQIFQQTVFLAVIIASVAAMTTGVISSYFLWRTFIAPLYQVAASSRRVADGRYTERVPIPENSGEAMEKLVINFNEMAEALERVEEQRVTLLGNVSHELRTPLASLHGYLEGLVDGLFPANEETFGWMAQEVDRLSRLVDDLHNLSRVETGQISLDLRPFDARQAAERVWAQMQPQAQAQGVALQLDLPDTAVTVHADPDRAAQILINLVGNALRYTPAGGRITIRIRSQARAAVISVEDTGQGIPPAALPYLFERFYRVDVSRARASGGSGIGLTISRHLVWAMGGEITAASEGEGKGSIFTFTLPLAPAPVK